MRPTASKLELAFFCLWPWSDEAIWAEDAAGPAARMGSAFHEFAAAIISRVDGPPIEAVQKAFALDDAQAEALLNRERGWLEHVSVADDWRAEVAYAYDPRMDTAREIEVPGPRDYRAATDEEIVGTADVEWLEGDTVVISDWKTGRRENVGFPGQNPQLRFLALCAARVRGVSKARVQLCFVDEDGRITVEQAELESFDLAAIAGEMAELDERLGGIIDPEPGAHCRYCPAVSSCPATSKALAEVAPAPAGQVHHVVSSAAAITGPAHAAWLLHRLRAVRSAADIVESALQQYSDGVGGIALGQGIRWGRHEVPTERLTMTEEAEKLLRKLAPGAVLASASKASIRKALKSAGHAEREEEVLAALRTISALKSSMTVKYEEMSNRPKGGRS